MHTEDVLTLLGYSYWATKIILDTAGHIAPGQFAATVTPDPGRGSLRGTLVHMLDTEIRWRRRLRELEHTPDLMEQDFPDVATLKDHWAVERENWFSLGRDFSTEALNRPYTYQFGSGPARTRLVWQSIMHVLSHGIQHRSEAAYLLTGYGHSPGEVDFNYYLHIQSGAST